jgi:tetratricopeptide (TPR) repeat protein
LNEERRGNFAAPYVNLSTYYNRLNRPELALEYSQKALKVNPKSDSAYFQIAKAHRYREEWRQTAEALEAAISINALPSQYHYLLGTAYRHLGRVEESQKAFETFQKRERESADFERERREARRGERSPAPITEALVK